MLQIVVPGREYYDESTCEFIETKDQTLVLEHSLISLSKWESKWHKPFLGKQDKTEEEVRDYVKCMTMNHVDDDSIYFRLSQDNVREINAYLEDPMTATWFTKSNSKSSSEVITSELIYYWMVALEIPFECQKWHLNRLLTLIRVCNAKNAPSKKMSKNDIYKQNRALNAARRAKTGGRG